MTNYMRYYKHYHHRR